MLSPWPDCFCEEVYALDHCFKLGRRIIMGTNISWIERNYWSVSWAHIFLTFWCSFLWRLTERVSIPLVFLWHQGRKLKWKISKRNEPTSWEEIRKFQMRIWCKICGVLPSYQIMRIILYTTYKSTCKSIVWHSLSLFASNACQIPSSSNQ
jgi:hypothetical protein